MINLLPIAEKQKLLSEKKEKITIIWGIVVLVFLVCLGLVLFSIKFCVLAKADSQKAILRQAEAEKKTAGIANLNSDIQKYNQTLSQLNSFYKKEIYFNKALKIITDIPKPEGIYLTNFSLSREGGGAVKFAISGVVDTREELLVYKKNIEMVPAIKNLNFSSESWISPKNANFSFTFGIIEPVN